MQGTVKCKCLKQRTMEYRLLCNETPMQMSDTKYYRTEISDTRNYRMKISDKKELTRVNI